MRLPSIALTIGALVAPLTVLNAQDTPEWDRVALNGGEASLETPCASENVVAQGEPRIRSLFCVTSDVRIVFTLMPKSMTILPIPPGTAFDEMVEYLLEQPTTRYAVETELEGNPAFRTEGDDNGSPTAVMMADVGDDMLLTLLVTPAPGAADGASVPAVFERAADSVRLAPPEEEEEG